MVRRHVPGFRGCSGYWRQTSLFWVSGVIASAFVGMLQAPLSSFQPSGHLIRVNCFETCRRGLARHEWPALVFFPICSGLYCSTEWCMADWPEVGTRWVRIFYSILLIGCYGCDLFWMGIGYIFLVECGSREWTINKVDCVSLFQVGNLKVLEINQSKKKSGLFSNNYIWRFGRNNPCMILFYSYKNVLKSQKGWKVGEREFSYDFVVSKTLYTNCLNCFMFVCVCLCSFVQTSKVRLQHTALV